MLARMLSEAVCTWKRQLFFGLMLSCSLVLFCQLPVHANQSVTLAWDANRDPQIAGYRIYFGLESQNYTDMVDVGNVTSATINLPLDNSLYYFAATTYDAAGEESDYSNETVFDTSAIVATTPDPNAATLTALTSSKGQFGFSVSGAVGTEYIVQASTDLVKWVSLQTNAAPFVFVDTNAAKFNQRFYRTMLASAATSVSAALPATLTAQNLPAGQFGFTLTGSAGSEYVVEASTNLVDWVTVQTNTAPFTYVDANAAGFRQRFFRAFSLSP
jgi:hypothetical protein